MLGLLGSLQRGAQEMASPGLLADLCQHQWPAFKKANSKKTHTHTKYIIQWGIVFTNLTKERFLWNFAALHQGSLPGAALRGGEALFCSSLSASSLVPLRAAGWGCFSISPLLVTAKGWLLPASGTDPAASAARCQAGKKRKLKAGGEKHEPLGKAGKEESCRGPQQSLRAREPSLLRGPLM